MQNKAKAYIGSVLISLGVGALSAYLTRNGNNIFDDIETPPLTPPAIVFPIVWSILFFLLGISAARVYIVRKESPMESKIALRLYGFDLAVNFLWSLIFFNARNFGLAFVWLLVLLALSVVMTVYFYKVDRLAGLLQIPYLIWITFAGYLTLLIFKLNP